MMLRMFAGGHLEHIGEVSLADVVHDMRIGLFVLVRILLRR